MGCFIEEAEFCGKHTTIFWHTNDDDPPAPCATCQQPDAPWLCDWPMVKPVPFEPYDAIGVGDVLTQENGWRARIVGLEHRDRVSSVPVVDVRAVVLDLGSWSRPKVRVPFETEFPVSQYNFRKFGVERPATCDAPCCDAHVREVGEEVHYCAAHWNSWETAAFNAPKLDPSRPGSDGPAIDDLPVPDGDERPK